MLSVPIRFIWAILAILAVALMLPLGGAMAQSFPELSGRVVDSADLLDPAQEAEITSRLEALETQSGRQFVVATIPDLEGYDIADYGYQLGRTWGIGDKERNDGVLMIVAPNDRKVRIESGYGLEGIMTDALSSVIIQSDILPRFRDGDMPAGIAAGVDRISAQLILPEDEARAFAQQAVVQTKKRSKSGQGGLVIFWIIVILFIIISSVRSAKRGGKRYRSGAGPVIIWGGGGFGGGSSGGFGGGGFGGFSGGGGGFGGGGASGGW